MFSTSQAGKIQAGTALPLIALPGGLYFDTPDGARRDCVCLCADDTYTAVGGYAAASCLCTVGFLIHASSYCCSAQIICTRTCLLVGATTVKSVVSMIAAVFPSQAWSKVGEDLAKYCFTDYCEETSAARPMCNGATMDTRSFGPDLK